MAAAGAFAAAVWSAAGRVTVAAADSASTRLVIPAPWWVAVLAFAAALTIPVWRRRPLLVTPALLATLPWLPVPLPAVALLWTGPLAWLPILVTIVVALGGQPFHPIIRALISADPRRGTILSAVLTLALGGAAAWAVAPQRPLGDEPHYLMITQSLLKDGDLRIENNHRQRDYAEFSDPIEPHYLVRGRNEEIYSIHAPGLGVLVLPAFALFGYRGVEGFLLLLAAAAGALIWRTAWLATGRADAAWFAWAAVSASATFVFQSFSIFPDGPAALIAAAAIYVLVRLRRAADDVGSGVLTVVSTLLAGLPWLNSRLAALSVACGLAILWLLLSDEKRTRYARVRRVVAFAAVPAISAAAWFAFFQIVYGTPNPAAPYGVESGLSVSYIPGGLAGLLFDGQFGLAMYAPVMFVVALGFFRAEPGVQRWTAWAAGLTAATYLGAATGFWIWWGGQPASPARLATPILPACAILAAIAWVHADAPRRRLFLALLSISAAVTTVLVAVQRGAVAWNVRDAEPRWLEWLGPVVNLSRGWPSFFWGSRLEFVAHVAVWISTFVSGWILLRRLSRSRRWDIEQWRLAIGVWLLAGLATATQIGWQLTRAGELDPARSQIAVLSSSAAGRRAARISPFAVGRIDDAAGRLTLRAEEPGRPDSAPPWLQLERVPPGKYLVRLSAPRPVRGDLRVLIGDDPTPIQIFSVRERTRDTFEVVLPAGASRLTLAPDSTLAAVLGRVELVPEGLSRRVAPFGAFAQASNGHIAFFCDYGVIVERDGFRLKGGQVAELAIAREPAARPVSLLVRNGEATNALTARTDATNALGRAITPLIVQESLAPFAERTITLPIDAGDGVRLALSAASSLWITLR